MSAPPSLFQDPQQQLSLCLSHDLGVSPRLLPGPQRNSLDESQKQDKEAGILHPGLCPHNQVASSLYRAPKSQSGVCGVLTRWAPSPYPDNMKIPALLQEQSSWQLTAHRCFQGTLGGIFPSFLGPLLCCVDLDCWSSWSPSQI